MHISHLHIEGFRNLQNVDLALQPGFNYLYGANGAGKTAVLEAVYLLARGRSFRAKSAPNLINRQADQYLVRLETTGERTHRLGVAKPNAGPPDIRIDGANSTRLSDLARYLPVQILLPEASGLVYDAPGLRRAFLDWGLFHVEQGYLQLSRDYRRVLQQRNAWLKLQQALPTWEEDPWATQLIHYARQISVLRDRYVADLQQPFSEILAKLSDLEAKLSYSWGGVESEALLDKKMSESFERDVKLGTTHRGPHRGDLSFAPVEGSTGEKEKPQSAEALSRGQAKLVASAAILAQAVLLERRTGSKSVLLIDDFGAELDRQHWLRFLKTLEEMDCQVIATSTEPPDSEREWSFPAETAVFHVKHGTIEHQ